MIEIKKEIGFRFCDNSRVLYASKDKDYLFLHPEIIDSELDKLEPYRPIACGDGNVLNLCDTSSYNSDYLHTFITESGVIIGKNMIMNNFNHCFTHYTDANKQIVISKSGNYLVINSNAPLLIFYPYDYFVISETIENNKTIYKTYNGNCELINVHNDYDVVVKKIMSDNKKSEFKKLKRKERFNLYRQRLLEAEKQLLEQKINRVIDLKNKEVVEGTFIDSIRMNEGKTNLYFQNIEELENLTESYKRERIKKESV